jgi:hypothetical protein
MTGRLYRCYGYAGELLYIGKTTRPVGKRTADHARTTSWWGEVAYVVYEDVDGYLDAAEEKAIRTERPRYNVVYGPSRRGPDCRWCNDRRCIIGPGYALVACPGCADGAWWPPFPAPLPPGDRLYPEVALYPKPCGHLGSGTVAPTRSVPTGLTNPPIAGTLHPATPGWVVDGREVPPPGLPRQGASPAPRRPSGGLDPSGRSSVPLTLSPLPGEEHPPDDHHPKEAP